MAELTPHPLVISVAMELGRPDPSGTASPTAFQQAATAVESAVTTLDNAKKSAEQASAGKPTAKNAKQASDRNATAVQAAADQLAQDQNTLANEFADQAGAPAVCLFAGYLGGPVDHDGNHWRLLYLDALLTDWMLILKDDILVHERLSTENAPAGLIDMLWVKATANLVTGTGPRANAGRFLVGELTRAGDFAPSTRGGTFSAASGLLCEATTPGCCRYTRSSCHG